MAEHGTVEYATAAGNDYPAHEQSYERFVHFTLVGVLYVVTILLGLATGGVMDHWFLAAAIFVIGLAGAVPGLLSGTTKATLVAFVVCFLIFVYAGVSH
jgi:small-conductance mechanosensitive channel